MKYTITAKVTIKVESDLEFHEMLEEFQTFTDYNFDSTDNVKVISTSFEECE